MPTYTIRILSNIIFHLLLPVVTIVCQVEGIVIRKKKKRINKFLRCYIHCLSEARPLSMAGNQAHSLCFSRIDTVDTISIQFFLLDIMAAILTQLYKPTICFGNKNRWAASDTLTLMLGKGIAITSIKALRASVGQDKLNWNAWCNWFFSPALQPGPCQCESVNGQLCITKANIARGRGGGGGGGREQAKWTEGANLPNTFVIVGWSVPWD